MFGKEAFCPHFHTQVIIQAMPPLMRQRTGPVHLGKVNDFPQRFVVGGGVAAAAGAKGNRECSLVGNIFFADLKDSRQVFESVKPHVQGSAPVILRHPVPKFAAAESERVKVILPDHITVPAVIRARTPDAGKLLRDKPLFSAGSALSGKGLYPFQSFLTGGKICFQYRIAFCDIVGIGKPDIVFRVGSFAVIEPDVIAAGDLLFSGNAKLFFYSPLDDFSIKVPFPAEIQGIYQLIGNDRIIPALLGGPDITAADSMGNTLAVTAVNNKGVEYIHGILHCLNLFNDFLYLPDGRDIFFLPCQALLRRII